MKNNTGFCMKKNDLLSYLFEVSPHINPIVAKDWIYSTKIEMEKEILLRSEVLSKEQLEKKVEDKVRWHINRLNGFGGSDMSVLYTEYKGGFYPHDIDARGVVANKLCLTAPSGGNGHTERGHELEPVARRKFLNKMEKFQLKPFNQAFELLKESNEKGLKYHEWMKSSPDDVFVDKNNEIWLVDYKCPSEHSTFEDMLSDPPDYYKAQLAQYKYQIEKSFEKHDIDIKINHVALVPFSTKEWDVGIAEFLVTEELTKDILMAGDLYWKNVLENTLPLKPVSTNFQLITDAPVQIQQSIAKFIYTKKMKSVVDAKDKTNKTELLNLLLKFGVNWDEEEQKTRVCGVDISKKSKITFNTKQALADAVNILNSYNSIQDSDNFLNEREKFKDCDQYNCPSESTTVSVIRGAKNPHSDFINDIESIAKRCFDFGYDDVLQQNNFDISDEELFKMSIDPTHPIYGTISDNINAKNLSEHDKKEIDIFDDGELVF